MSKIDDWLRCVPARPDMRTHGDVVVIHSAVECAGQAPGISAASAQARALRLHLVMIPPGTRSMPVLRDGGETEIYAVSGAAEVWHGTGLVHRMLVRAGDVMYIPPGTTHLVVNRGEVTAIAVVASSGQAGRERARVIDLPRHLAGLHRSRSPSRNSPMKKVPCARLLRGTCGQARPAGGRDASCAVGELGAFPPPVRSA